MRKGASDKLVTLPTHHRSGIVHGFWTQIPLFSQLHARLCQPSGSCPGDELLAPAPPLPNSVQVTTSCSSMHLMMELIPPRLSASHVCVRGSLDSDPRPWCPQPGARGQPGETGWRGEPSTWTKPTVRDSSARDDPVPSSSQTSTVDLNPDLPSFPAATAPNPALCPLLQGTPSRQSLL